VIRRGIAVCGLWVASVRAAVAQCDPPTFADLGITAADITYVWSWGVGVVLLLWSLGFGVGVVLRVLREL
jgi:hypothetical protein